MRNGTRNRCHFCGTHSLRGSRKWDGVPDHLKLTRDHILPREYREHFYAGWERHTVTWIACRRCNGLRSTMRHCAGLLRIACGIARAERKPLEDVAEMLLAGVPRTPPLEGLALLDELLRTRRRLAKATRKAHLVPTTGDRR